MPETSLAERSCIRCRGGVPPMSRPRAVGLLEQIPGWTLGDDARGIERRLKFKTFAAAFACVTRIAELAEAEDHHPDIAFGWGYATISLQTHAINGLHENDFILAAKIDTVVNG